MRVKRASKQSWSWVKESVVEGGACGGAGVDGSAILRELLRRK
jgi:hypothetical protein